MLIGPLSCEPVPTRRAALSIWKGLSSPELNGGDCSSTPSQSSMPGLQCLDHEKSQPLCSRLPHDRLTISVSPVFHSLLSQHALHATCQLFRLVPMGKIDSSLRHARLRLLSILRAMQYTPEQVLAQLQEPTLSRA